MTPIYDMKLHSTMKCIAPVFLILVMVSFSCQIREEKNNKISNSSNQKEFKDHTTVAITDTIYDFGNVKEGELVTHQYQFKNTGKKPLIITNAIASCGCTVPEKPEHPIAPGEIGFIKVKFDSERRPGAAHKTITVFSNAQPEFPVLQLKGTVIGSE